MGIARRQWGVWFQRRGRRERRGRPNIGKRQAAYRREGAHKGRRKQSRLRRGSVVSTQPGRRSLREGPLSYMGRTPRGGKGTANRKRQKAMPKGDGGPAFAEAMAGRMTNQTRNPNKERQGPGCRWAGRGSWGDLEKKGLPDGGTSDSPLFALVRDCPVRAEVMLPDSAMGIKRDLSSTQPRGPLSYMGRTRRTQRKAGNGGNGETTRNAEWTADPASSRSIPARRDYAGQALDFGP